jgi:hypothetical protein
MNLHGKIMNLQAKTPHDLDKAVGLVHAYRLGHQDARHAAADVALGGDAAIQALRDLDARLRECMALGLSAAEAYDSLYQEATAEALAVGAA